jgi:hypothetical protein
MTTGQINIWRRHVYAATLEALIQRRPFTQMLSNRHEFIRAVKEQTARATFCAKYDGDEYSRYPRYR